MTFAAAVTRRTRIFTSYPGVIAKLIYPANGNTHGVEVQDKRGDEANPAVVTANAKGAPTTYIVSATFDTDYA